MSSQTFRAGFLAGLILFTFGLLHVAGLLHKHDSGQTQGECQVCHITAQPFLNAEASPETSDFTAIRSLPLEHPEQIAARPRSPYGARAPPSA